MVKVSIIIPMLNEELAILATLESIKNQSSAPYEVIIVDSNSTDRSCEIVRSWQDKIPNLKLLNSKQKGRGEQMNMGAASATGDWLLFNHADTLLPINAVQSIQALQEKVSAGCFKQNFSNPTLLLGIISRMHNLRCRITRIMYGDQSLFVRRTLFHVLGGYKAELIEDVKISEAILSKTKPYLLKDIVITDSRKFKQRGVLRSLLDVIKIVYSYHRHKEIPESSKSFFLNIR